MIVFAALATAGAVFCFVVGLFWDFSPREDLASEPEIA